MSCAIPYQEAIHHSGPEIDGWDVLPFSPPEQLHFDQGKQFESKFVQEICKLLKVRKTQTSLYLSQCGGVVERFNWTLLNKLATMVKDHLFNWKYVPPPQSVLCLHSVHSSTRFTFLMFGLRVQLPLDLMYGIGQQEEVSTNEYAQKLKRSL